MNLKQAKQNMEKTIDALHQQLLAVRSSQVNPALIGSVKVDGRPINHIASVSKNKSNLSIVVFENNDALLTRIEKTLQSTGLNAYKFSKDTVCVTVEQGHKSEVIAHIKKAGEDAKIAIRNIRKTVRQKNKTSLTEIEKPLEKMTGEFIKEIESYVSQKAKAL